MLEENLGSTRSGYSERVSIGLPVGLLNSLRREFALEDSEVESFVASLVEKSIMEHASAVNSKVFTESESKEIEDDLRGLGYI